MKGDLQNNSHKIQRCIKNKSLGISTAPCLIINERSLMSWESAQQKIVKDSKSFPYVVRIGPDRAYPLHFTHPQLLLLLLLLPVLPLLYCTWALSFEIIEFQPLISLVFPLGKGTCSGQERSCEVDNVSQIKGFQDISSSSPILHVWVNHVISKSHLQFSLPNKYIFHQLLGKLALNWNRS